MLHPRANTIQDIQRDLIIAQKVRDINESNSGLDVNYLDRVLREEKANKHLGNPFLLFPPKTGSSDRKIGDNDHIDIGMFNDTLHTINTDIATLRDSILLATNKINRLNRTIDRTDSMLLAAINKVDQKYREHRKQVGLARFIHREGIVSTDNFDLTNTTATIDTEHSTIVATAANLFNGNIQIGYLSSNNLEANADGGVPLATDANFWRIFMPNNKATSSILVARDTRELTTINISLDCSTIPKYYINTIVMETVHTVPTLTNITVISDGERVPVIRNQYLDTSTYTFNFDTIKAEKIIVSMTQTLESFLSANKRMFSFNVNFINPELIKYVTDAEFYSAAIAVDFPISDVSLETVDQRPYGTNILYYISTDNTYWSPITVRNLSPDAPNSIVNIGTTTIESTTIDGYGGYPIHRWKRLTPDYSYGNSPLYNLIEFSDSQYVTSGVLNATLPTESTYQIDEDSIKLYRGIDEYSIEEQRYEIEVETTDVLYRFQPSEVSPTSPDDYNHDVMSTDVFIRIEEESHTVDNNGYVTVNYAICNNNLTVTDITNNVALNVAEYVNAQIRTTGALPGTKVEVTYHTKVTTIETTDDVILELIPESFYYKYSPTGVAQTSVNDMYYSPTDKKIYLNINNTLPSTSIGWLNAYLSFRMTKKSNKKFMVFRTFVRYDKETEIIILPFTNDEVSRGNFHIIDNDMVSTNSSHTLSPGWHEIITTQPYKTDPDYYDTDVNKLTNQLSKAGILLGSEYEYTNGNTTYQYVERRAYRDPMRKVSTFTLANRVSPFSYESYSYSDGKILSNFIPEYLPDNSLIASPGRTGKKLLLKEARYLNDGKLTFGEYYHNPEQFYLEYRLVPKEGSDNDFRTLYVKGVLKVNRETFISPYVFQYDVLFF